MVFKWQDKKGEPHNETSRWSGYVVPVHKKEEAIRIAGEFFDEVNFVGELFDTAYSIALETGSRKD